MARPTRIWKTAPASDTLRRAALRAQAAAAALCIIAVAAAGCFFDTRDPRPLAPDEGGVCFEATFAASQEILFADLEGSLACRQASTYEEQLTDDFLFKPTTGVKQDFPQSFAQPWGKARERLFVSSLTGLTDSVAVQLRVTATTIRSDPDSATIRAQYSVQLMEAGQVTSSFAGSAEYTVVFQDNRWKLLRWEELASGGTESPLGVLRATVTPITGKTAHAPKPAAGTPATVRRT